MKQLLIENTKKDERGDPLAKRQSPTYVVKFKSACSELRDLKVQLLQAQKTLSSYNQVLSHFLSFTQKNDIVQRTIEAVAPIPLDAEIR